MNILLTGGSGFLGGIIRSQLLKEGHTIITLGRCKTNDIICDLSLTVPDLKDRSFDAVIHCAGKAHFVPKTEIERNEFYNVNVTGTHHLLSGLGRIKYFCFISSVSVYGLESGNSIKEDAELKAKDSYGLSKIEGENIVSEWCKSKSVLCTILRLPLIIDKESPGNFAAMLRGIKRGLYFNIGTGNAKKSMVLASDVAKGFLQSCKIGGVYNLTDGNDPSFKELSNYIAKEMNLTPPKSIPLFLSLLMGYLGDILGAKFPVNSRKISKMVNELTFDDTLARERFGWNPEMVLKSHFLKD